jgi:ribosomal protein S18 acetylase RimI-like enzyme
MKKYSVRPATPRDLEAVHALIAAQNRNDYGEAIITVDDLQRRWKSSHFETDTCTAYANGELVGYAELRDGSSPFIYLADPHNVDLGFQLLTILEKIAIERKIPELDTQVSIRNQTLSELFLVNGYHSTLSFLIMELIMNEAPPVPQWAEGIQVRTFIPGQDEEATFRADEEAAQDKGYHQPLDFDGWCKRMGLKSERFDPGLWFLACDGIEIAGVALNMCNKTFDTGWVDHLSVRRAWRKKGIGKALLLHSFGEFYRCGVRHIKLSVDSKSITNAPRLYESVGMKTIQEYRVYKKQLHL